MAQYLPYIPETLPEPALYKPDFNFYDKMLQRKQSLFEQGASKVKSAYSSVLNAQLSNKNNIPLRDQYIKDAQEKLTKLSSSDLSLMENVNAAEGIYAPFWQDKFIVQDAAMTKSYQNEMQKLDTWKNSAKPEDREKYSAISMMDLQNGLSVLQNADRTPEAFSAVEMRKAEPFTNIEGYLQKQAKEQGMDIKYDDPNGAYLVETVNGQRSQKKYATWATAMIGNNFQGQFDVTGRVENEERIKTLKRSNPNLTDADAKSLIAKDVVSELSSGYTKRNQEVDVELARIDSLLSSIGQTGGPNNKATFDNLVAERAELTAKKAGINEEYKGFDQSKDKLLEYVSNAPKQYFSLLAKQRLVNNWATGRASIDQKLVKENAAFTSAQNIQLRASEHALAITKAEREWDQQLWERANPGAKAGTKTGTGNTTGGTGNGTDVPGVDESGSMMYVGKSGIDITKTAETAYDVYSKIQKQNYLEAHNLIFDQRGILGFASKLGLSQMEISQVATVMQKEVSTDGAYTPTPEEIAASKKLETALLTSQAVQVSGINPKKISADNPAVLRNALIAYAGDYLSQRSKVAADGSDIPLSTDEFEALMRYSTAVTKLDSYKANDAQRQKLLKDNLLNDPKYSHLLVDIGDGKKDLVTISDLQKGLKSSYTFKDDDDNDVTLTGQDIATAYINGDVKTYTPGKWQSVSMGMSNAIAGGGSNLAYVGYTVKKGGKNYNLYGSLSTGIGTSLKSFPDGLEQLDKAVIDLDKKYKSSQDIAKDIKGAHDEIVPNLLMYKNLTGKEGSIFTLVPKANKTMANGDNATAIIHQASQVGNIDDVYDKDGNPILSTNIDAIRTLLASEKNIEEYVTGQYIPQGINGKRTVRVTLSKPLSSDTKQEIGGVNLGEIGTEFNFVLKDNTSGTYLDQLPNNTGFQVHDAITRGKEIKSDPVLEAAGFSYTITPNTTGVDSTPEYVTVDLKYKVRSNKKDPQTGQINSSVEEKSYLHKINLVGTDAKSPDEIVGKLQALYYENMLQNRSIQLEYDKVKATNGGLSWDPKNALKSAGLSHLIK
jgi:hypothetical protein